MDMEDLCIYIYLYIHRIKYIKIRATKYGLMGTDLVLEVLVVDGPGEVEHLGALFLCMYVCWGVVNRPGTQKDRRKQTKKIHTRTPCQHKTKTQRKKQSRGKKTGNGETHVAGRAMTLNPILKKRRGKKQQSQAGKKNATHVVDLGPEALLEALLGLVERLVVAERV